VFSGARCKQAWYSERHDGRIDAIEHGQAGSAWGAEQLGRPVVKAFNTIGFQSLLEDGRPRGAAGRVALPVAGDAVRACFESQQ
jgi:predicted dinucleotide-binding enzyme